MSNRLTNAAESRSFRFFAPEQIDAILRQALKLGRTGSHGAIERILKHEPGFERAELWKRIRRLKCSPREEPVRRAVWSAEDDQCLRDGYGSGPSAKRQAISELLKRHPDWRPHLVWKRAAKLGLVRREGRRGEERRRSRWSENDDRILLNLAGDRRLGAIARILHRSEHAVCCRLASLGKRTRVQHDGYARRTLCQELHMGRATIQRLIADGLLEVHDPRVTTASIAALKKSGLLAGIEMEEVHAEHVQSQDRKSAEPASDLSRDPAVSDGVAVAMPRLSRSKQVWSELARSLGVSTTTLERFIAQGILKFRDPRVTEPSLKRFCRWHGAAINYDFLNRETRQWLQDSMELDRRAGQDLATELRAARRHALIVRKCPHCGREVRGNAFSRHRGGCGPGEPQMIGPAARACRDRPRNPEGRLRDRLFQPLT